MARVKNETAVLEKLLGHKFKQRKLLVQALTHSSYAYEQKPDADSNKTPHNEQMEFLGDAVLGFLTGCALYEKFPAFREGQLSRVRAQLVRTEYLSDAARKLDLGKFLRLGRGEERSHGREKTAILADSLEAVISAIYLDGGITPAKKFVLKHIVKPGLQGLTDDSGTGYAQNDPKSALQERTQATSHPPPAYHVIKVSGPDHKPVYEVEVRLRRRAEQAPYLTARGSGTSKKHAEQNAASAALSSMNESVTV